MSGSLIECVDVFKAFGTVPALRGVSLAISPGEMVAITGPSGSGKSTLLHCLAGVQAPDAGTVSFEGIRIDDLTPDRRTVLRRRSFGFVFQFGQLIPELTAEQNIALPLLLDQVERSDAFERARAWLERVDLGGLADRAPSEMSGGQRQRVAVARALVHEPVVVLETRCETRELHHTISAQLLAAFRQRPPNRADPTTEPGNPGSTASPAPPGMDPDGVDCGNNPAVPTTESPRNAASQTGMGPFLGPSGRAPDRRPSAGAASALASDSAIGRRRTWSISYSDGESSLWLCVSASIRLLSAVGFPMATRPEMVRWSINTTATISPPSTEAEPVTA